MILMLYEGLGCGVHKWRLVAYQLWHCCSFLQFVSLKVPIFWSSSYCSVSQWNFFFSFFHIIRSFSSATCRVGKLATSHIHMDGNELILLWFYKARAVLHLEVCMISEIQCFLTGIDICRIISCCPSIWKLSIPTWMIEASLFFPSPCPLDFPFLCMSSVCREKQCLNGVSFYLWIGVRYRNMEKDMDH